MTEETKTVSPYLRNHPIRTEEQATADIKRQRAAQGDVIDLDEARKFKALERPMAGDEE